MLIPALVGVVCVAIGAFVAIRATTGPRLAVALLRTPTGRVSDLMSDRPARICLVGTVEASDAGTVQGPFSDRESVALNYEVQEWETSGKSSSWESFHEGTTDRPFVLKDSSGRVRIQPAGAVYALDEDTRIDVDGGERPPERIQRFIEASDAVDSEETSFDLGPFSLNTGEDRRYLERRLEPGDEVLVLGRPVQARGDVGMVNAEVRVAEGSPLLVADGGRRAALSHLLLSSLLPVLVGLVFVGVGLFLLVGSISGLLF